tara:strand:- start:4 stop:222 length:219 start_codon:yes stop_codon:yes gene_type:complete
MTTPKADHSNKRKWMDKWRLTDPASLKDLPDNPDQKDNSKKMLYGDFIKKVRDPNLQTFEREREKFLGKKFI